MTYVPCYCGYGEPLRYALQLFDLGFYVIPLASNAPAYSDPDEPDIGPLIDLKAYKAGRVERADIEWWFRTSHSKPPKVGIMTGRQKYHSFAAVVINHDLTKQSLYLPDTLSWALPDGYVVNLFHADGEAKNHREAGFTMLSRGGWVKAPPFEVLRDSPARIEELDTLLCLDWREPLPRSVCIANYEYQA